MLRGTTMTGLLVLTIGICGCGKKDENARTRDLADSVVRVADSIAVIDLNVIAEEIGARQKITDSMKERENDLVDQLSGYRDRLDQQVEDLRSHWGDNLNDEQQTDLDRTLADNQSKIGLQIQAAQSQLATHHARLKMELLNQVRPVAFQVAREQGMSVVMTTGQVYAIGPEQNITQAVIEQILKLNQSTTTAPPAHPPGVRIAELPGGGEFLPR